MTDYAGRSKTRHIQTVKRTGCRICTGFVTPVGVCPAAARRHPIHVAPTHHRAGEWSRPWQFLLRPVDSQAGLQQQEGGLDKHKHSMTSCRSTWSCSPASLWCLHLAFRHSSHEYERSKRTEATSLAIRSHPTWRVAVWADFLCSGWAQSLNRLPKGQRGAL